MAINGSRAIILPKDANNNRILITNLSHFNLHLFCVKSVIRLKPLVYHLSVLLHSCEINSYFTALLILLAP